MSTKTEDSPKIGRPKGEPVLSKDCPDPRHEGPNPVPASGYHQKKDGAGGLNWRCKACANRTARESDQAKRARIGEEAWKAINREKRAKNRERQAAGQIPAYDKAQQDARRAARRALATRHQGEYEQLRKAAREAGADSQQARNRAENELARRYAPEWETIYARQRKAHGLQPVGR